MAESFDHSPRDLYITGVTVAKTCDSEGQFKEKEIDRGAYGAVLELSWQGTSCAGKRIHPIIATTLGDKCVQDFQRECTTWSKLRHPYVAQFLGLYSESRSACPIIVMEKVDTSLSHLLEKRGRVNFPLGLKVRLLHHVALGLVYLHGRRPMVIHRDLHPKNILIDLASMTAKLADFGVAKILNSSQQLTANPGHPYFMPPEVDQKQDALPESGNHDRIDVFSFGGVVIMTMAHDWPAPTSATVTQDGKLYPVTEYERRKKWVEAFTGEQQCFLPLVKRCLENEPSKRPTSADLAAEINQMKETRLQLRKPSAFHQYDLQKNLEDAQQELKEAQDKLAEANSEVQQLTDCMLQKEKESEATTRQLQSELIEAQSNAKKLSNEVHAATECIQTLLAEEEEFESTTKRLESELIEAKSKGQQLSNELCTVTEHNQSLQAELEQMKVDCTRRTEQVESELAATRQRLKAKEAELHGAQQQLTQLQAELTELTAARKPTLEANDRRVHTSTQLPPRQWKVDELYLHVQERSIIQQKNIDSIVHTLEDHIQDSVERVEFAEGSQMYVACERYSESYKNWELGYEIILCSVLQLCYETCGALLAHKVACEAVRAYKDGRSFAPEVVTMLQNSLTEEDHGELEGVASFLVANGFTIQAQAQPSNSKKYMAVYSLITAYLDIIPAQDYIASAKRDILADKELKFVTVHPCVEAFVDKVLPLCWQLITMYVPPILTCDQKVKVNGAHHDLSHVSSRADTVQSYLFPVVWYGGDVHRKARVLAENFK